RLRGRRHRQDVHQPPRIQLRKALAIVRRLWRLAPATEIMDFQEDQLPQDCRALCAPSWRKIILNTWGLVLWGGVALRAASKGLQTCSMSWSNERGNRSPSAKEGWLMEHCPFPTAPG